MTYVDQTIMLYTLNLCSVLCQLYFSDTGRKKVTSILCYFFKKNIMYIFSSDYLKNLTCLIFFSLLCASACIIVALNLYCLKKFNEVLILWVIASQLLNVILNILSNKIAFNPIISCSLLLVF